MKIEWNKVTWYSKLGAIILFILVVPVLTFYIGIKYEQTVSILSQPQEVYSAVTPVPTNLVTPTSNLSFLDGVYSIGGEKVALKNGVYNQSVSLKEYGGTGSQNLETRIFGEPALGDLNGDGVNDAIFFVYQETGGTGIFFYAVAAINQNGKYVSTNAIDLGDRISPQNIHIVNGVAEVNYAIRKDGEPMSQAPSIGVTKRVRIEGGKLIDISSDPFSVLPQDGVYSNIIGYVAHGAFVVSFPRWFDGNWKIQDLGTNGSVVFKPVHENDARDFSDITMDVMPSTEIYNAESLYQSEKSDPTNASSGFTAEVLFNTMEDMRINHVQRKVGSTIVDKFFIDGNKQTAIMTFSADATNYAKYGSKVREFVEGFGKGTAAQG